MGGEDKERETAKADLETYNEDMKMRERKKERESKGVGGRRKAAHEIAAQMLALADQKLRWRSIKSIQSVYFIYCLVTKHFTMYHLQFHSPTINPPPPRHPHPPFSPSWSRCRDVLSVAPICGAALEMKLSDQILVAMGTVAFNTNVCAYCRSARPPFVKFADTDTTVKRC